MIVIWDNVDWLMRGWSFVPHLCTILIGQSDIIDGCCLKVKVVAEVNWFDFGSIECEWSFCPFSMLCVKIGLEVICRCASFSKSHFVSQSVSDWYFQHSSQNQSQKISEFCPNFIIFGQIKILPKLPMFAKFQNFCPNFKIFAQISEFLPKFWNFAEILEFCQNFRTLTKFQNFV